MAAVREALDREVMAERLTEGRRLPPAEVVAEALHVGTVSDGHPIFILTLQPKPGARDRHDASLTARQIDVLRLVAAGMSNREIGHGLRISDRTVERHLTAIFGALDVDRRSAALARATTIGILSGR